MDIETKYPMLLDPSFIETYDFDDCWTKTHPDEAYDDLDVAAALVAAKSNITKAAKLLGRSRRSLHNFVLRSQLLSDFHEDLEATFLDDIEERHREAAYFDKDVRAFFLRTKGRTRGYVTRSEATGNNGGPIEVATIDTSSMSTEALRELRRAMNQSEEDGPAAIEG